MLAEPGNTQLKHDISWSYDKIAVVKLQLLDFEGALEAQFVSLSVRRKLVGSDGKQVIWRRDLAAALHQIGEIKRQAGDLPSALMFFLAAAEARLALKKEAPNDAVARASFETSMAWAKRNTRYHSGTADRVDRAALPRGCRGGGAKRRRAS